MSGYDPSVHGPRRIVGPGFHRRVYDVVRRVPVGRVTTYGDVAMVLGARGIARKVGQALAALPTGNDVPWHRVVNAHGGVSPRPTVAEQVARLRAEGIEVDADGRVVEFERLRYRFEDDEASAVSAGA